MCGMVLSNKYLFEFNNNKYPYARHGGIVYKKCGDVSNIFFFFICLPPFNVDSDSESKP